jgi:hypothetical protein
MKTMSYRLSQIVKYQTENASQYYTFEVITSY